MDIYWISFVLLTALKKLTGTNKGQENVVDKPQMSLSTILRNILWVSWLNKVIGTQFIFSSTCIINKMNFHFTGTETNTDKQGMDVATVTWTILSTKWYSTNCCWCWVPFEGWSLAFWLSPSWIFGAQSYYIWMWRCSWGRNKGWIRYHQHSKCEIISPR